MRFDGWRCEVERLRYEVGGLQFGVSGVRCEEGVVRWEVVDERCARCVRCVRCVR